MREVSLRASLNNGDSVVATFLLLPRLEVVELASAAGFGAVIIDLEHGPIAAIDLPALAAAARGSGIYAIARVADNSATAIGQALDAGVDGVMVPHVCSPADAKQVVSSGRYAATGDRSLNPYTRGNGYDLGNGTTTRDIDERVALIAMLEGADIMGSLEAICDVSELDAIFVGPVDLSASLGLKGNSDHPKVVAAVTDALTRVRAAHRAFGVYASTADAGGRWLDMGAALVAVSADTAVLLGGLRNLRGAITAAMHLYGERGEPSLAGGAVES
jgi:2-keto-3-deoxy-L-rhamnonate aldolase RhmA